MNRAYNLDILETIASLSNDEERTLPVVADEMLDILPDEIWDSNNVTFLDPSVKTGVFLRNIAKRLVDRNVKKFKSRQDAINHVLKNQVYGCAITELTALMARRTVYCSKQANSKYSICKSFNTEEGNISYKNIQHTWKDGHCVYCGATEKNWNRGDLLESHAYEFIHTENPDSIFNMKFDVIIGNPPYQMSDGGAGASAITIYHKFFQQAKKLNPRYIVMILQSRWFSGGKGLDKFREEMINDTRFRYLCDFPDSSDVFKGPDIKGGVNYFLWDREYDGKCNIVTKVSNQKQSESTRYLKEKDCNIFIRDNKAAPIYRKIIDSPNFESLSTLISSRKPFGLETNFKHYEAKMPKDLTTYIKLYMQKSEAWIEKKHIKKNIEWINAYKVLTPKAIGSGLTTEDIIKPILASKMTCCTETYILHGPFESKKVAENYIKYINTKFFHFMLGIKKVTQDATSSVYEFLPVLDFNQEWNDEKLFNKYKLNDDEVQHIKALTEHIT